MQLLALPEYFALTPEQKSAICNGFGPADCWKARLVPNALLGVDFTEACNAHDLEYHLGRDRLAADWRLHCNMVAACLSHCKGNLLGSVELRMLLAACGVFLLAVHEHGEPFFGVDR